MEEGVFLPGDPLSFTRCLAADMDLIQKLAEINYITEYEYISIELHTVVLYNSSCLFNIGPQC